MDVITFGYCDSVHPLIWGSRLRANQGLWQQNALHLVGGRFEEATLFLIYPAVMIGFSRLSLITHDYGPRASMPNCILLVSPAAKERPAYRFWQCTKTIEVLSDL